MAEIVSKLFSDNDESASAKVDKNIIESDATTFGKRKSKKANLTSTERKKTKSIAEIIADVFFEKKESEKDDTSLKTKVSGNTPAAEARKPVSEKKGKMPKKGGILDKLKGVGGAVGGIMAAAGALALLVGVGPIPGVLPNLANIDWGMIGKAFVILGGLAIVGKLMGEGGKGMLFMAGALAILAGVGPIPGVLENMANIDWSMIAKGFVILAGLGLVGRLMKKGSYGILIAAAALALLAGIGPIPGVLQNMAEIEWGTIGKALLILGGIALAGKLMQKGAVGLLLGALALTLLVRGALVPLQEIEWSTIGKALVALVGFGIIAAIMGSFAPLLFMGALAIAALGLALIPFAYAMGLFSEAVAKLSPALEAVSSVIDSFGDVFTKVFDGIATVIKSTVGPMKEFNNILKTLTGMDGGNLVGIGLGLGAIGVGMAGMSAGNLGANIADGIGGLFGADSPIEKLIKLGAVAGDINLLGESFDSVISGFKEFFNYLDDVDVEGIALIGGAIQSLAYGFMALAAGNLMSSVLDGIGKLFGGDSPIEKLQKLGAVAGDINELGDSINDLKNVDLDEIKISDGVFDRIHSLTAAVYKLIAAQAESVRLFGQMNRGSMVSKLFGFSPKSNRQNLSRSTAINGPTSSKKDPLKKLTQVVESLQVELQNLAAYSRLTSDNTGKTVEAIKNIKPNSTVVAPGGNGAQQTSPTTPETLLNSRADYSASPYSLGVPSAV